jgi:hypothetical protein
MCISTAVDVVDGKELGVMNVAPGTRASTTVGRDDFGSKLCGPSSGSLLYGRSILFRIPG